MNVFIWSLVISSLISPLLANPFAVKVPSKEKLVVEDYLDIQKQLQAIDVTSMLKELYVPDQGLTSFEGFASRCMRGASQIIIDQENGLIPIRQLEKIGQGGDRCIVCYVPYVANEWGRIVKNLAEYVKSNVSALQATGFNGYFYYQIGGFPNPTGKEMQYVGVPYCAKIFMMLEAYKLGFKKVLWVDSALLPLRNPSSFFIWIERRDHFIQGWLTPSNAGTFIFPATRQLLQNLTGTDVLKAPYINSIIFGLKMDAPLAQKLIEDYYHLVELGTPFLSCFPEEFVLTALLGKPEFSAWVPMNMPLFLKSHDTTPPTPGNMQKLKDEGYFFYQRPQ
jgi:hypothetical protein